MATSLAQKVNHASIVTTANRSLAANTAIAASSLIASVTDQDGDKTTYYRFRDNGAASGGYFTLGGVKQAGGQWITVSAADLAKLVYVSGTGAGSQTIDIQAYDGKDWSASATATATTVVPNHASVVTAANQLLTVNTAIAASSLIASVTDQDGDKTVQYRFRDNGTASGGYFTLGGVKQAGGQWITVSAADLSKLVYVGGTGAGSQTIDIQAYDGKDWSAIATATSTTTTSKLLAQVSDAAIRSLLTTIIADGVVSYGELKSLFQTVASGGVTQTEAKDLQTFLTFSGNEFTMSSYLADIAGKLVNGGQGYENTALIKVGGTALGNFSNITTASLSATTSANRATTIIDEWFSGSDLPSTQTDIGRSYAYSAYNASPGSAYLYGSGNTPLVTDINQGYIGDCWLESSFADIAAVNPNAIKQAIVDNGNGTYGIRFYIGGKEDWITVNDQLPVGGLNQGANHWASLLEKACAQLNATESTALGRSSYSSSYISLDGGWMSSAFTLLTNHSVKSETPVAVSRATTAALKNINTTLISDMRTALTNHLEVGFASTYLFAPGSAGNGCFTQGEVVSFGGGAHAYSVIGYDNATSNFIVRNPWGNDGKAVAGMANAVNSSFGVYVNGTALSSYYSQFEMSAADIENFTFDVDIAQSAAASGTGALVSAAQTFSFDDVGADLRNGQLGNVTTADGFGSASCPSWIPSPTISNGTLIVTSTDAFQPAAILRV